MNGDKRKFLFVSITGLISDIAWQVVKEGHEVRYCIEGEKERDIADGFVPKVRNWEREVDWADVIVFDDTLGQGEKAQALRASGKLVVGGTPYTDRLEDDRSFGQEELKKEGINIVPYRDFDDFDDAISYVKENPERYVIKPSGAAGNVKRRLFVGDEDDGQDVIRVLEAYKKSFPDEIRQFQLQRRVTGVEVAVRAFFNGKEFIYPLNVNFEHKKLFPGNIGPSTGEMGTAMFWSGPNILFNSTLKKMEAKLASEGYVGYIDLNCIVNGNGIYPLEFTARFGYPTISIQQEGMTIPISQFLADLASGLNPKLKVKSRFQIGGAKAICFTVSAIASLRARCGVRAPVWWRTRTSEHRDVKGRCVSSPKEHIDRSGSIGMRANVFVTVLGVDAVERIGRHTTIRWTGCRADDHPQLVARGQHERHRP
jgi:phosphoribosylamine---glycine ligase